MRLKSVHAVPLRLPRDLAGARGTAGSPTPVAGQGNYRWSTAYPVLYPIHFETALVRVELENGLTGWGEAQAPLAPEVACTIIEQLLRPAIEGEWFDGTAGRIAELGDRMYATMRVRGQNGGFMFDAMSGVDLALWDLAGKLHDRPVRALLSPHPRARVPAYLSGTSGQTLPERAAFAARYAAEGISLVKLYYESAWSDLLALADALPATLAFAVDALWHLPPDEALAMARDLDDRSARWLECPFYPEEVAAHAALAAAIRTPLALGESYRSRRELQPFLGFTQILQPDLGRCGLTESTRLAAAFAGPIIPHVSIAMGPQIAAALHFAAATPTCPLCEYNPHVLDTANAFLQAPILRAGGEYHLSDTPGLGIEWNARFHALVG